MYHTGESHQYMHIDFMLRTIHVFTLFLVLGEESGTFVILVPKYVHNFIKIC